MSGPTRHNFQQHRSEDAAGDDVAAGKVPTTDGSGGWTYEDGGTGGVEIPYDLGTLGSTETIDLANGTYQRGTLDVPCTIDATGFTVDEAAFITLKLTQDGTGGNGLTWTGVTFAGDDQPDLTADAVSFFVIWTDVGDSTIYGTLVGGSSGSALEVLDEGSSLDTAVTSIDVVGAGATATNTGHAVTLTIPGGATASDTGIWRPVMDGAGNVVTDGATGEAVMAFS